MRFMMLMIPDVYKKGAAADFTPDPAAIATMRKFNEDLQKAGVLLSLDGLTPPSAGARVSFTGGKALVTDGPFAETKDVIGGYWIIEAASRDAAVAWAVRCPAAAGDIIEVRRIFGPEDFGPHSA
ncbi:MAG TPA: YciI family protein [Rhizomicrobium sp.]|jgi:hypothetical protein|nr:YciI family protein [Rhizomicrobium sp.]